MTIELTWTDRRGASCMRSLNRLSIVQITALLKRLRCSAELMVDGQVIGGIEDLDEGLGSNVDDRRIRWNWYFDTEALQTAFSRVHTESEGR